MDSRETSSGKELSMEVIVIRKTNFTKKGVKLISSITHSSLPQSAH